MISEILNALGLTYMESEAWHAKKSIECLKEAVRLDPLNETAWANQTPVYAMLLDLDRSKLVIEISKKVRELKEISYENPSLIARVEQELDRMIEKYWNAPFISGASECPTGPHPPPPMTTRCHA